MKSMRKRTNKPHVMKTRSLFIAVILLAIVSHGSRGELEQLNITRGPKAGSTIRLVKQEKVPKLVSSKEGVVKVSVAGQWTNLPVDLSAWRYEGIRTSHEREWPVTEYELRVEGKAPVAFQWSCWWHDAGLPHGFQVLNTESRRSYACYVAGGVLFYRLSEDRDSESMRRQSWENTSSGHPDSLPSLPIQLLEESLGRTNMLGLGPQAWNINVDSLSDAAGELRVTLHGAAPQPQCTFALRTNKWELVSCSGK
jgi:hypothetical protein